MKEPQHGGTGNYQDLGDVVAWLRSIDPGRVLDVGCGFGRWGFLCREFVDVWSGRTQRDRWQVHLTGVEAWAANLREQHRLLYNELYAGPIEQFLAERTDTFDLAICGDVLEHLAKPDGERVLDELIRRAGYVLVVVPEGGGWPQGEAYANPYEVHRALWCAADILKHGPLVAARYRDHVNRPFIAAVLSARDPRNVRTALEGLGHAPQRETLVPLRAGGIGGDTPPEPARSAVPRGRAGMRTTDSVGQQPRHIALVVGEYPPCPGGIAAYAAHLARLLGSAGHRVSILTPSAPSPPPEFSNVHVHMAPGRRVAPSGQWLLDVLAQTREWAGWASRRLLGLHSEHPLDVVEVTDYYLEGLFLEPDRLLRGDGTPVPVVTQFHNGRSLVMSFDGTACPPLLGKLEQLAFDSAVLRKTYSPLMAADVERRWPGVPCAFVPAAFQAGGSPGPSQFVRDAAPGLHFDLLYFGRLQGFKGLVPLAHAVQKLANEGIRPRLALIGDDTPTAPDGGSMRAWLQHELLPALGERLTVLPAQSSAEALALVRRARVVVLPSLWESLSFAALEAATSGRPLLLSQDAGAAYVFTGELGRQTLVNVRDTTALARRLHEALDMPEEGLRSWGEAQRRAVEQAFAPERVLNASLDYYRNCAAMTHAPDVTARAWTATAQRHAVIAVLADVLRIAQARRAEYLRDVPAAARAATATGGANPDPPETRAQVPASPTDAFTHGSTSGTERA